MRSQVCLRVVLALVVGAGVYVLWQRPFERPTLRLPSAAPPVIRAAQPVLPPTAREILDRAMILELRHDQMFRLQSLDRLWTNELSGLERDIEDAEREFSSVVKDAQASGGASGPDIERRALVFSGLSAGLRDGRERHAKAALGLLDGWQRERFKRTRPMADIGRDR
jgi:hypothetical protein